jgi:hypothetical protein
MAGVAMQFDGCCEPAKLDYLPHVSNLKALSISDNNMNKKNRTGSCAVFHEWIFAET